MSELISAAALLTLGLFAVYLMALAVAEMARTVRAHKAQAIEHALLSARIARLAAPSLRVDTSHGHLAWSGYRKFVLQVKVLEGEDVCSFYLAPHDGQALPAFLPGQYLTFRLQIPGQARPVTRCYSLSDSPTNPDYYRVTVKRLREGVDDRDADGLVSHHMHRHLAVDDLIDVKAPGGQFHLDPDSTAPLVLIAGGIGVTPLLSMLTFLAATGANREIWFFYGVQNSRQHLMQADLQDIATEHPNVRLHVCYSQPLPEDELGRDYQHEGWATVARLKALLPSSNYQFYVCGPAPMMHALTVDLAAWGVPDPDIHIEAFGPATVRQVSKDTDAAPAQTGTPLAIEFARSGNTLSWDGSAESLLDFAEAHGIAMESGCRAGNCGSCVTAIRSGKVKYLNEPGSAVEEGSCLTCISVPRGNLVLDA